MKERSGILLFLFMATSAINPSILGVYGWGNGTSASQEHPYYGVHDAISEYAYYKLMSYNATMAKWISDYFFNPYGLKWGDYGYSFGERSDNWLGYTDDPDSYYRDWNDHMYEVHGRRRGAVSRIKELYEWTVANLTNWIRAGMPYRSEDEHRAVYSAGLLSHYLADLSQFGHTDYTAQDHSHPSYDPKDDTYHAYYESSSIDDAFLNKLSADLESYQISIGFRASNISDLAVKMAEWTNLGPNGSMEEYFDIDESIKVVGSRYKRLLTEFVANYNSGRSYIGARGYDESLYDETLELIRYATAALANTLYSAFKDAEERATSIQYFKVENLSINPAEVLLGDTVLISCNITNMGDIEGRYSASLRVNGKQEVVEDVYLRSKESKVVTFELMMDSAGIYEVEVDGLIGTISVRAPRPAKFMFCNLTINPTEVNVGEPVTIAIKVVNTGEAEGTCTVTLKVDDKAIVTKEVTIMGGESTVVGFNITRWMFGTYEVEVNGQRGRFVVSPKLYILIAVILILTILAILVIRQRFL